MNELDTMRLSKAARANCDKLTDGEREIVYGFMCDDPFRAWTRAKIDRFFCDPEQMEKLARWLGFDSMAALMAAPKEERA